MSFIEIFGHFEVSFTGLFSSALLVPAMLLRNQNPASPATSFLMSLLSFTRVFVVGLFSESGVSFLGLFWYVEVSLMSLFISSVGIGHPVRQAGAHHRLSVDTQDSVESCQLN